MQNHLKQVTSISRIQQVSIRFEMLGMYQRKYRLLTDSRILRASLPSALTIFYTVQRIISLCITHVLWAPRRGTQQVVIGTSCELIMV